MTVRLGCTVVLVLSAPSVAQADVKELVRQLGDTNHRVRNEAYRQLRTTKPAAALPLLAAALPGYPIHSQNLGLSVIQVYGRERGEPIMRRLVKSSSSFLIMSAAIWLYQWGDRSMVSHAVRALRNPSSPQELSMMLGRASALREPEVSDAVLGHVKPDAKGNVLDQALRHLDRVKHTPAIPVVAKLLKEGSLPVAQRAVCAAFLVAMGEGGYNKVLAESIRASKNFTRIRDFLQSAPSLDREVLAAVLDFIEGKSGHQVGYALRLLAHHDYAPAVRKMRELLDDDDAQVSKAAFDSLMSMGTGLEPKHLKRLLGSSKLQVSIAAADALRRLDDFTGMPRLIELARKSPIQHRREAVEALGKFRLRKVVPVLIGLLEDSDRNVRDRAYRGLSRVLSGLFPYRTFDLATTGYQSTAPDAERREAVAQIRHWWKLQDAGK